MRIRREAHLSSSFGGNTRFNHADPCTAKDPSNACLGQMGEPSSCGEKDRKMALGCDKGVEQLVDWTTSRALEDSLPMKSNCTSKFY